MTERCELIIPGSGRAVVVRVAAAFGLTAAELIEPSRWTDRVRARNAAVWLLRTLPVSCGASGTRRRSFSEIGQLLGRERTSARHACNRCAALMDRDPDYAAKVLRLQRELSPPAALGMAA